MPRWSSAVVAVLTVVVGFGWAHAASASPRTHNFRAARSAGQRGFTGQAARKLSIAVGTGEAGRETPGPALLSMLNNPTGVAVDAAGNLYIADPGNLCVEKVTPAGVLSVVAGNGHNGRPIPGPALRSTFNEPFAVAVDPRGGLYVADSPFVVKISRTGVLSMVAGTATGGAPTPGPAIDSSVGTPKAIAVGPRGSLFIADTDNNVVDRITPNGILSVVAGTGTYGRPRPGPAGRSRLALPSGIAVNRHGTLFIADAANEVVERVRPGRYLSIVAGDGHAGRRIGRTATTSRLGYPTGVALDPQGHLDILSLGGMVDQLVDGILTRIAGTGRTGPPTVGPALNSDFGEPFGLTVDRQGNILVADQQNSVIEAISS